MSCPLARKIRHHYPCCAATGSDRLCRHAAHQRPQHWSNCHFKPPADWRGVPSGWPRV